MGTIISERPMVESSSLEVSVVMPCLNEAETVGTCVSKAFQAMTQLGTSFEVIVADNGSSDDSVAIAQAAGAKIVPVVHRGYGAALAGGIAASRGRFVIMGDADDSYDFLEATRIVEQLRIGADFVQGCRFPSGGGSIQKGAMPFLHRMIGNPFLSWLVRRMFDVPIHDVYCGLRGFRRELYDRLQLRSPGMEFATEMVIRAGSTGAKITQTPVTLRRDGRTTHGPHLRTFRDGWRTLRLFLVFSPRWTFFYPGCIMLSLAALGYALAIPNVSIGRAILDVHTLLVASLAGLLGWQSILMACLARIFAGRAGLLPRREGLERITVDHGVIAGVASFVLGTALVAAITLQWYQAGFGELDYPRTMRVVVPGVAFMAAGFQTVLSSLFGGVLRMMPIVAGSNILDSEL